ncbi:AlbA family DNA-binding domain-containing protein [Streptosporangium sp. CA-115845]|uniref:AlbA family DNA-binding domain-containing protein n=1 Tax=Streptosporangium sp. CA-115845 TaxID=3240071 RepID=UPI003D8A8567
MTFRFRRLEALLGVPLAEATYRHFADLINVFDGREADDLDFKATYAGPTKSDSVAADVATFANSRGGVIVIGINDKQGVPVAQPGVSLADSFIRELHTAIMERVRPVPVYDIKSLPEDPGSLDNPKQGLLLIIVPPSVNAPHAVMDPTLKGMLKFPYRHESQKFWMSELQVAAAYRRRYTVALDSAQRAAQIETEVLAQLARSLGYSPLPQPVLTVSLAPEMPGDLTITAAELDRVRQDLVHDELLLGRSPGSAFFTAAQVGSCRFIASGPLHGRTAWTHLHTDGAASVVFPLEIRGVQGSTTAVSDTQIVLLTLAALRFFGRHAAERAGATGTARLTVRAVADVRLFPAADQPLAEAIDRLLKQRSQSCQPYDPEADLMIVNAGGAWSGKEPARNAYGESTVFLDDLLNDAPPLAAATGALAGALLQAYGVPEPRQIRPGGILVPQEWEEYRLAAADWAGKADIAMA